MSNKLEAQVRDPALRLVKRFPVSAAHKRMHFGHGTANGWPDDLILFQDGHHWWIEFKGEGKEPTPKQEEVHRQMRALHADVSVIDNFELFQQEFHDRMADHTSY